MMYMHIVWMTDDLCWAPCSINQSINPSNDQLRIDYSGAKQKTFSGILYSVFYSWKWM